MFPSEHESRYITHQHPKGGIAPSRYDLAVHEYMCKQHDRRQIAGNVRTTSALYSLMRGLLNREGSSASIHIANHQAR